MILWKIEMYYYFFIELKNDRRKTIQTKAL